MIITIDTGNGITEILARPLCEPGCMGETEAVLCRYEVTCEQRPEFRKVISVQCEPSRRDVKVAQKAIEAVGLPA